MIGFFEKFLALSPVIMLVLLTCSIWVANDNGRCPRWLQRMTVVFLAVFCVLMVTGAILTW